MSTGSAGIPLCPGNESVYVSGKAWKLNSDPTRPVCRSGAAKLVRIGLVFRSYILEQHDRTTTRTTTMPDGATANGRSMAILSSALKLGPVRLHVFGAEASVATDLAWNRYPTDDRLAPPVSPALCSSRMPIASAVRVARRYGNQSISSSCPPLLLDRQGWKHRPVGKCFSRPNTSGPVNAIQDYGVDANYKFTQALKVWGGYSKTDTMAGTHNVNNKNDQRYDGYLGYMGSNWGVDLGGRYIDGLFVAPGSWAASQLGGIRSWYRGL